MPLVRIIKDWDWPDIMRQSPAKSGVWESCRFTLDDVEACDFAIVLNNRLPTDAHVQCPPEHIWMLVQEPYEPGFTDWVIQGHDPFARIYTHRDHGDDPRYRNTQAALAWHVNKDYDMLAGMREPPEKSKNVSWIVGGARDLPGHFKRWQLIDALLQKPGLVDLYGKKIRPIEDKWDGLAPYRYSIAVENNSNPDMWTEKLADCLLAWTVPFYYGCTNLDRYFPKEAYIPLPLDAPEAAMRVIEKTLREDNWQQRVPAIREARDRILNQYQLFPFISREINALAAGTAPKTRTTVPAYRPDRIARLRRHLFKMKREWRRGMLKLRPFARRKS